LSLDPSSSALIILEEGSGDETRGSVELFDPPPYIDLPLIIDITGAWFHSVYMGSQVIIRL